MARGERLRSVKRPQRPSNLNRGQSTRSIWLPIERALRRAIWGKWGKGNPNLHDIPSNMQIHVELWDRYSSHVRWVIAATSSMVIGNAAYHVAVSVHPQECAAAARHSCDPGARAR